jgi:DNA-binding protein H-NS
MATYAELQAQIVQLQREAETQRTTEINGAKDKIRAIMSEYGLKPEDLGMNKTRAAKVRAPVPTKYRDDTTGQTWTGRGRAPKWLEGKDKTQYLIK